MVGRGKAVFVSENAEKRATECKGDRRRRGMEAASVRRGHGRASISGKGRCKDINPDILLVNLLGSWRKRF